MKSSQSLNSPSIAISFALPLWTLTHVTLACAQGEESHFSPSYNGYYAKVVVAEVVIVGLGKISHE